MIMLIHVVFAGVGRTRPRFAARPMSLLTLSAAISGHWWAIHSRPDARCVEIDVLRPRASAV
jgi:hypothetical protein